MTDATRDLLEQHFDTAFAAPDGIAKLRELILTLAMRGKLVEQDPADQPASELLKDIDAEKQRLVKAGKIKAPKPLPPIKPEEVPYQLPQGWEWVRVREICHDWGQKTPDSTFTYIDVGAIDNTSGKIGSNMQILGASDAPSRARKIVKTGTVIYSTVRPYLLNIAIIDKEYDPEPIASTAFAILHPFRSLSARFIYHYLRSPAFIRYVEATQKGVAYPAINDGDFFSGLFPLPPFPEQNRIVALIDQLMACCDTLEALRKEREEKRLAIHAAAMQQLLAAPDSSAWGFIEQHFGELYSVKENVAELRKAILQLAAMGRLVPQDPEDPPTSELLKEIDSEKQRLVKEKIIKSPKPVSSISQGGEPFQVPENWRWVRIAELAESIDYGTSQKTCDDSSLIPVYRMGNIIDSQLIDEGFKYIAPDIDELPYLFLKPNDILFNRTNSYELVGKSARYTGSANQATFASYLIRIRLFDALLNPTFISQAMNAPYFRSTQIEPEIVQQCGQANFNGTKLSLCLIPLPPLPEQHRIVARIEQLMALCDTVDQKINDATDKQTELLHAVMAQV